MADEARGELGRLWLLLHSRSMHRWAFGDGLRVNHFRLVVNMPPSEWSPVETPRRSLLSRLFQRIRRSVSGECGG